MGTQQLMILVVVIIVAGAAIVVGYTMFQQQNYINNRSALSQDMQIFLTQVRKSYMLLATFGGLSRDLEGIDAVQMANNIGWNGANPMTNASGQYLIEIETDKMAIEIRGIGNEAHRGNRSAAHGRISFPSGEITVKHGTISKVSAVADVDLLGE